MQKRNQYTTLIELYRCNDMHREALKLLLQLVEECKSDHPRDDLTQKITPQMIIDYLKVILFYAGTKFSMILMAVPPTQNPINIS